MRERSSSVSKNAAGEIVGGSLLRSLAREEYAEIDANVATARLPNRSGVIDENSLVAGPSYVAAFTPRPAGAVVAVRNESGLWVPTALYDHSGVGRCLSTAAAWPDGFLCRRLLRRLDLRRSAALWNRSARAAAALRAPRRRTLGTGSRRSQLGR